MSTDWDDDMTETERDQWAEDHGYVHRTCRIHGPFYTDSGEGCPSCPPEGPEEPEQDAPTPD